MKHTRTAPQISAVVIESTATPLPLQQPSFPRSLFAVHPVGWLVWAGKARRLLPAFAAVLLLLALGASLVLYFISTATAQVAITPAVVERTMQLTLVARPDPAGSQEVHVYERSASQERTGIVATATGTQVVPAQQARGLLTWYNQGARAQRIPAGTRLTVSATLHMVTEQDVLVPGGAPTIGEASGPAHMVEAGPQGNLAAGLFTQLCPCGDGGAFLKVVNQAFSGGSPAGAYPSLLSQDIDRAAASGEQALLQQARLALHHSATEQWLAAPTCITEMKSAPPAGSMATRASVTIQAICNAWTVDRQELEQRSAALLHALPSQDAGYLRLVRCRLLSLHISAKGATFILTLAVAAKWISTFDQQSLHKIALQLAGQSQERARQFLERTPGIARATIFFLMDWLPLPASAQRIRITITLL